MTFTAKLKRTSTIWTTWRQARRVSGEIGGAVFRLAPGLDYVSGVLTAEQFAALRNHNAVTFELTTGHVPAPTDVVDEATRIATDPDQPADVRRDAANAILDIAARPAPSNRFSRSNQPKRKAF